METRESLRPPTLSYSEVLADQKSGESTNNLLKEGLHAFGYAALQAPITGASQMIDRVSADLAGYGVGGKTTLEQTTKFMSAPAEAAPGSRQWHAQQIGGAAGLVADFALVRLAFRRPDGMPAVETTMARETTKAALTGMTLGAVFTPVSEKEKEHFWSTRMRNSAVQGLTFGSLTAASMQLQNFGKAMAETRPLASSLLRNEIVSGIASGVPAGLVCATSESVLSGKGLPTIGDTAQSVYTFSMVGGWIGLGHKGIARLDAGFQPPEPASTRLSNSKPGAENGTFVGSHRERPGGFRPELAEDGRPVDHPRLQTSKLRAEQTPNPRVEVRSSGDRSMVSDPPARQPVEVSTSTRPDGTKVVQMIDGSTKTITPDRVVVREFPSGKEYQGRISKVTEYPDGRKSYDYTHGEKITKHRDGTMVTETPAQGKRVTEKPDGTIITEDPQKIVTDREKFDQVKGKFTREVSTFDKGSGKTTSEFPSMSRNGDFVVVEGYTGRRTVTTQNHAGRELVIENITFDHGPTERISRNSDGYWEQVYREGSVHSEGYDLYNGKKVHFERPRPGTRPDGLEVSYTYEDGKTIKHFNNPYMQGEIVHPDGRVETIFKSNGELHNGIPVGSKIVFPDGSVSRSFRGYSNYESQLALSNGVSLVETKPNFMASNEPVFSLEGPDGTSIKIRGGQKGAENAQPEFLPAEEAPQQQPGSHRADFDTSGVPERFDLNGHRMEPFDIYDVREGRRYLFTDGSMITVGRSNMTVRYADKTSVTVNDNLTLNVAGNTGKYVISNGLLTEHTNPTGKTTQFSYER